MLKKDFFFVDLYYIPVYGKSTGNELEDKAYEEDFMVVNMYTLRKKKNNEMTLIFFYIYKAVVS